MKHLTWFLGWCNIVYKCLWQCGICWTYLAYRIALFNLTSVLKIRKFFINIRNSSFSWKTVRSGDVVFALPQVFCSLRLRSICFLGCWVWLPLAQLTSVIRHLTLYPILKQAWDRHPKQMADLFPGYLSSPCLHW